MSASSSTVFFSSADIAAMKSANFAEMMDLVVERFSVAR
jgi:hypothetical protein